ncbi:hypothetical protein RclHR1_09900006 [Rhizophagus clarus]|uniref:Uncharacterized protein n=1 Tax=Rhizophagus clarus TaxID=94130 RepID=A0A2Z6S7Y0_9GLOM|nr:hypothetical protein RclHR1_09900006 [Rhizophagus clarus]
MPDLIYKSKLYVTVVANQIHICNKKCKGPAPSEQTCKKGFSRPYSKTTHYKEGNSQYIYKCLIKVDSWVVSYHPVIFLRWDAYMNTQYITD